MAVPVPTDVRAENSCNNTSCICCSRNVSIRQWERRTVQYNPAEGTLEDVPIPTMIGQFLSGLCNRSAKKEAQNEQNVLTIEQIDCYLQAHYNVNLQTAASNASIADINHIMKGQRPMRVHEYHTLKEAAEAVMNQQVNLNKSRSVAAMPTTKTHKRPPNESFSAPKGLAKSKNKRHQRYQQTVWKRPTESEA